MHDRNARRQILRESQRRGKVGDQAALLVSTAFVLKVAYGNVIFFEKDFGDVDVKRVPRFVKPAVCTIACAHRCDQGVRHVVHSIPVQMGLQRCANLRGDLKVVPIVTSIAASKH